jgi:hypothetical protein
VPHSAIEPVKELRVFVAPADCRGHSSPGAAPSGFQGAGFDFVEARRRTLSYEASPPDFLALLE